MGALDGIRVLSFNHFLSGPAAAQHLGDIGADVITVEPLGGAFQRNWAVANRFVDDTSVNHITTGRNKRSIAVDLKSPEGIATVKRLIETADVVMENFRPGTLDKLGLSEAEMRKVNPRIIYATTTGYGVDGPYAKRPGQDVLLQAMTGLAAHTGSMESGPVAVGSVPIDHHAAALTVAGIIAALFERERTGKARRVDVNMLQAAMDLQGESITAWMNGADRAGPRGEDGMANWFSPAPYGIYAAKDGHVMISMSTPPQLAGALELPALAELSADEGFSKRGEVSRARATRVAVPWPRAWPGSALTRRSPSSPRPASGTRSCRTTTGSRATRRSTTLRPSPKPRALAARRWSCSRTRSATTARPLRCVSRRRRLAARAARCWPRRASRRTRSTG